MLNDDGRLLLASGSPRRCALLRLLGVPLLVRPLDVDEEALTEEPPRAYLKRVVQCKGEAATALSVSGGLAACPALLVADTIVVVDGGIVGKPRDDQQAAAMIGRLAGRGHEVMTRFLLRRRDGREVAQTVVTAVTFRALEEEEVGAYVATGEGRDKAGGYAIQGVGAALVSRIDGSYSNVVGLPLAEVWVALRRLQLVGAAMGTRTAGR